MPKLQDRDVERNKRKIEAAALRVFTRQGYHGTSVREIADAAGVSIGNLYNYYRNKEQLFVSLVNRYEARMERLRRDALGPLMGVFLPDDLKRLAKAIRNIVYHNPDYWRLMYIDIIEFHNRHFAGSFRHLARGLQDRLGPRLRAATRHGQWCGMDPAFAFSAVYMQFFTYFLVEKLFGGKQHLGVSDERAVEQLVRLFTSGLWLDSAAKDTRPRRKAS